MIQRLFVALSAVAVMLCSSSVVWATPIPIANPSFETPAVGTDGAFGPLNSVFGWSPAGGNGARVFDPIETPTSGAAFNAGQFFGAQVLELGGAATIAQTITPSQNVNSNVIYVLSFYVGNSLLVPNYIGTPAFSLTAEILGGTIVFASLDLTPAILNAIPNGDFVQFTLSGVAASTSAVGQPLGIRFRNNTVIPDDFTFFTAAPVYLDNIELREILPEPGTWALMAVASVFGTGYLVKRHRRSLAA